MNEEKYFTSKEFCNIIKISTRHLTNLIKQKKINPIKKGNRYYFNDFNIAEYNKIINIRLFEDEVFKDIEGHPNYQISNYGRVYSKLKRKELTGHIDKDGYLIVNIDNENNRIHRLVALNFLEKTYTCETVNHKDCNKLNNHVSNLEWMTFGENTSQAYKDGLNKNNKYFKTSKEKIISVCEYLSNCDPNESLIKIGKKFNISRTTITSIYNKTRFKEISDNYNFVILKTVNQKKNK